VINFGALRKMSEKVNRKGKAGVGLERLESCVFGTHPENTLNQKSVRCQRSEKGGGQKKKKKAVSLPPKLAKNEVK